ncbi:unnamed protein product [Dovyalis caffra]|uniref:Zinc finger A20 and AN1 domain-containing stress-associated protein 8 n=1 Tax=Dovyalis caffra TaxID=77055 RepID=A0AAV1RPC6_9ROSI|nr:unnamed protein product [Dovyalis caffra]
MASTDSSTPPLCAKGCGFFGSPENKNLCSKCYKDYLKEEVKLSELVITPSAHDKNPAVVSDERTSTTNPTASSSTRKTRCENCNKKVGLTGFNCRCGKIFCGMHRHAEEHSCTFDFKTLGRQGLAKQNPLVVADKLGSRKLTITSRKMISRNSSSPSLCAKGCGFFGSPENKNLCSKCYKDYLKEKVIAKTAKELSELVITSPSAHDKSPVLVSEETVSTTTTAASASTVKNLM